jgi:peptidoglycan/LPS O-acetylase OafA/YrhL
LVFLAHATNPKIAGALVSHTFAQTGIDAVTIFFVLSGFVISYTAATKDHTGGEYLLSRASRLWSVAIPAILLSCLLEFLGFQLDPDLYKTEALPDRVPEWLEIILSDYPALRAVFGITFLNEAWLLTIVQFSNIPYWSLSYEFCYYLIFAAAYYLTSWKRATCIALLCLLFGPKILLLFPIWLLGVALHRFPVTVSPRLGWYLVIAPIFIYALGRYFQGVPLSWFFDQLFPFKLAWSRHFVWHYFVGILVAINIIGFRSIPNFTWNPVVEKIIRKSAAQTLSIYLFHYPLIFFLSAALSDDIPPQLRAALILVIAMIAIHSLSTITEAQKSRWRSGILRVATMTRTGLSALVADKG